MKVKGQNKFKYILLENKNSIKDKTESKKTKIDQDFKTASLKIIPLGNESVKQGISLRKEWKSKQKSVVTMNAKFSILKDDNQY